MQTNVLRQQVLNSIEHYRVQDADRGGYLFSSSATQPTTLSLCLAILTAELYGALPNPDNEIWRDVLLSIQDPATGLFLDPRLSPADLEHNTPGQDYLIHQTTYFALNALDALGISAGHPLRFAERFYDTAHLEKWLEGLNWSDPWKESNWVMFIAAELYFNWQAKDHQPALRALHRLLDWLDAHQDSTTGFWGTQEGASLLDAMAAAYHFLPFYFCLDRPIHHPERMIDGTVALQQPDGLFHPEGGGDTCMDVDAIDILVKCSLITPHRSAEVESALDRAYHGLLNSQSPDGGFCRARHRPIPPKSWKRRLSEPLGLDRLLRKPYEPPKEIWHYSGWTLMPFDIRESDLWSTWFRSFGLAVISARYPAKYPSSVSWHFRRLPALGWHDSTSILLRHASALS